jgi:hypothetical protein
MGFCIQNNKRFLSIRMGSSPAAEKCIDVPIEACIIMVANATHTCTRRTDTRGSQNVPGNL